MQYKTIFEEGYSKLGILIYREDFKQFLKMMPNQDRGATIYTFMAFDEHFDKQNDYFRVMTYTFPSESFLYSFFLHWKRSMDCSASYSLRPLEEGANQLYMEEEKDRMVVHFIQVIRHSRPLSFSPIKLTVAGPYIASFSSAFKTEEIAQEKAHVLQKMFALQAKNKE